MATGRDRASRGRRGASIRAVLRRLERAYGPLTPPRRLDPLEELILTILSQNTSDTNRDRAWRQLRRRFASWEELAAAPVSEVEDAIRPGGLAATKAPRIQAVLRTIAAQRGRPDLGFLRHLPDSTARAFLESLPGVGPKSAACVLAFSLERPALPVDTHVHRLARRLGLIGPRVSAAAAHGLLERAVRPADRVALHVGLVRHGRSVCHARRPRCGDCVLADLCPRVGVSGRVGMSGRVGV